MELNKLTDEELKYAPNGCRQSDWDLGTREQKIQYLKIKSGMDKIFIKKVTEENDFGFKDKI